MPPPKQRRKTPVKKISEVKFLVLLLLVPMVVVFILMGVGWFFVAVKTGEIPDSASLLEIFKHFFELFLFLIGKED